MCIAAVVIIIFFIPYTASGFAACGKLFSTLFGVNYIPAMVISAIVIVLYTAMGGFLAASTTDLIQGIVMSIALLIIVFFGIHIAGGFDAVMDNARSMNTVQYKCPNCGGELVFNPEKQMFSCPYCASDFTEAEMEERYHTQNETAQKEADADAKTLKDENDEAAFEEHTRLYECPSCGAQIIADETTSATFCYYCHNPVVLAGRLKGNYKPAYVLPFAVQRDAAEKEFRAWCRKRWFLPSDFRSKQQLEKMSGVYVPFWLASCLADTNMSGIGQVVKSWRDGKYQVTETTEYTVSRQAKIPFERVPADGAAKIEDALMDAIEPFPIQEMRPFSMQYLSGFLAEKYDVDWEKIVPRIQSRVQTASEQVINETLTQYTSIKNKQVHVNMTNLQHDYVLLPVWFMSYQHGGKTYHFAMNGQTKKLSGTPPLSWAKLLTFCAALMVVIGVLGGLIGGSL